MPSARLLFATLLMCTASLLAQEVGVTPDISNRITSQERMTQNAPADPTKIFENATRSFRLDSLSVGQIVDSTTLRPEEVCYTMRSYVVARDSKDSDSVHPVRYSTCQPATRLRLKRTDNLAR